MKKYFTVLVVCGMIFLVAGCATLSDIAKEIPGTDPTAEIGAVTTLIDDVVKQPWDNILQIGLGYALALLSQWYKKKQGAK